MVVNWERMGPETMPTAPRPQHDAVYTFDAHGAPLVRCINPECGVRTPVWGVTVIAIGHMARIPNKRFGMPFANGVIDTRKILWIPFTKKGNGCPACRELLDGMQRLAAPGQTAFFDDGEKG